MPTYDYRCEACQHEFELFQSIKDDPIKKCPECKKLKLRRLIGAGAAVMFKGSGFYQTDYRSDAYKKRASEDQKPSDNGSSSESKGDSGKTKAAETKSSEAKPSESKKPK